MAGDHAPDFATAAEALAYISNLQLSIGTVVNGETIIDYRSPLTSLKEMLKEIQDNQFLTTKALPILLV